MLNAVRSVPLIPQFVEDCREIRVLQLHLSR